MEVAVGGGEAPVHRRGQEAEGGAHEGTPGLQVPAETQDQNPDEEGQVPAGRRTHPDRPLSEPGPTGGTRHVPDERLHAQRLPRHDARPARVPAARQLRQSDDRKRQPLPSLRHVRSDAQPHDHELHVLVHERHLQLHDGHVFALFPNAIGGFADALSDFERQERARDPVFGRRLGPRRQQALRVPRRPPADDQHVFARRCQ